MLGGTFRSEIWRTGEVFGATCHTSLFNQVTRRSCQGYVISPRPGLSCFTMLPILTPRRSTAKVDAEPGTGTAPRWEGEGEVDNGEG